MSTAYVVLGCTAIAISLFLCIPILPLPFLKGRMAGIAHGVLILLCLAAVGFGGTYYFKPELVPETFSATISPVSQWVDSAVPGSPEGLPWLVCAVAIVIVSLPVFWILGLIGRAEKLARRVVELEDAMQGRDPASAAVSRFNRPTIAQRATVPERPVRDLADVVASTSRSQRSAPQPASLPARTRTIVEAAEEVRVKHPK